MDISKLEYNSAREKLIIPEYGRHIQNLIEHACTIKDDQKRQATAETIVDLMDQIHPGNEKGEEIKLKYWKHAILISNFKLNVKLPNGETFTEEDKKIEVPKLKYPQRNPKHRHYGNQILAMIEKAMKMENQEHKEAYTKVIGAYMKMAYKNWHKEHYVSDEVIIEDLEKMTDGELSLNKDDNLSYLSKQLKNRSNRSKGRRRKSGRNNRRRRK